MKNTDKLIIDKLIINKLIKELNKSLPELISLNIKFSSNVTKQELNLNRILEKQLIKNSTRPTIDYNNDAIDNAQDAISKLQTIKKNNSIAVKSLAEATKAFDNVKIVEDFDNVKVGGNFDKSLESLGKHLLEYSRRHQLGVHLYSELNKAVRELPTLKEPIKNLKKKHEKVFGKKEVNYVITYSKGKKSKKFGQNLLIDRAKRIKEELNPEATEYRKKKKRNKNFSILPGANLEKLGIKLPKIPSKKNISSVKSNTKSFNKKIEISNKKSSKPIGLKKRRPPFKPVKS